ncbi:DUF1640 domain-containing protein [Pseudomonas fragi]|uniref:DUF1640 domain-containing protein n=1 Tax=Pseudomonas fragi TaxID=296 RepID=A0A266LTC5_PSEFR|nr:DUF1640 domain-containing protein [Pseudomonas fragi]OZY40647.1 DUF1640 domain-containing protein [Pseudomonas fragi]
MKQSITLYDALTSISMPSNKAKAVVDAWECDVEKLASKSDLAQTEKHLKTSISELGAELRALIKEQGAELRASIKEQGADLRSSISMLEAHNKIVKWQFGILFICISVPTIKMGYEFLNRVFMSQ